MSTAPNGKVALGTGGRATTSTASVDKTAAAKGVKSSVDMKTMDKAVGKKPAGKAGKPGMTPERKKLIGLAALAVVVVSSMVFGVTSFFTKDPDEVVRKRPNDISNPKLPQMLLTGNLESLPFHRQQTLIEEIHDRKKNGELEKQFKAGQLTEAQYKELLSYAWIGRQWDRMKKYYSLGPLDQKAQLDEWINDKESEPSGEPRTGPKRDKVRTKQIIDRFPSDAQTKIKAFDRAMDEREEERKREAKRIRDEARAAAAATRPTNRTGDNKPASAPTAPKPPAAAPR